MIERHLARLHARHQLTAEEQHAIRATVAEVREFRRGMTVVRQGDRLSTSMLVVEGFLARYKDLAGGHRQISELHVPGDFADLHGFTLKRLDHSILTITDARIAIVPHERIGELVDAFPRIMRLYWFSTNLDAAIHREWVVSLGSRTALSRVAALFCELHTRLDVVGLMKGDSFEFPLNQSELGECMGLTAVHVNRTLRQIRERGLATFRRGRVDVHDLAGLREVAEFDDSYLYLDGYEE
ncbi:Crp/Fnr family transcriptional regulator [Sphingomonas sp. ID0503]|uniref:Crp/Fnr family transcriptional regulator n=1 Tax=Sphingomonas sp. ID0503 TaxID=3399691 RepID=UPI003AFA1D39